jgi:hypothetical protein
MAAEVMFRPQLEPALRWARSLLVAEANYPSRANAIQQGKSVELRNITSHSFVFPGDGNSGAQVVGRYLEEAGRLANLPHGEHYEYEADQGITFRRNCTAATTEAQGAEIWDTLGRNGRVLLDIYTGPSFSGARHTVFLEIVQQARNGPYTLKIYNSGAGLRDHHEATINAAGKQKYCLVFIVENVAGGEGQNRLSQAELVRMLRHVGSWDVYFLYDWAKSKGVVSYPNGFPFNKAQEGRDCTLEKIHAFLVNNLQRRQYKQLRIINLAFILVSVFSKQHLAGWRVSQETPVERLPGSGLAQPRGYVASDSTNDMAGPGYSAEDLVVILGMLDEKITKYHQEFGPSLRCR